MIISSTPSSADPCAACPWREANRGKRHPDGWYTQRNLTRLWAGLRAGNGMSCHPTDPDNVVSPTAQTLGYRPAPEDSQVLECRGGVILQQRELHHLAHVHGADVAAYRRARPTGLTRDGIRYLIHRLILGGIPVIGPRAMARPDLRAPVGYTRLPGTAADYPRHFDTSKGPETRDETGPDPVR